MTRIKIRAFDLNENIDFEKFIEHFKKNNTILRWEDPLIIEFNNKPAHLYRFGAVVLFSFEENEIFQLTEELEKIINKKLSVGKLEVLEYVITPDAPKDADIKNWLTEEFYFDRYDEIIYFNQNLFDNKFLNIISFTIAQSVTLDRLNKAADDLEDEVQQTILWFKKYKKLLPILANRSLDKIVKILQMRHYIVSDLMILDKPYIVWEKTVLDELYELISRNFELTRRAKNITTKLDFALETTQSLSAISDHSRANFLELLIVILILWEIIWEFIKK